MGTEKARIFKKYISGTNRPKIEFFLRSIRTKIVDLKSFFQASYKQKFRIFKENVLRAVRPKNNGYLRNIFRKTI